jgi:hypothetical protein
LVPPVGGPPATPPACGLVGDDHDLLQAQRIEDVLLQPDAALEREIERGAIRSGAPRPLAFGACPIDFGPQELDNILVRQKLALPPR